MRKQMFVALIAMMPSFSIGCQSKHAKTEPPEILVPSYQKVQTSPGEGDPVWLTSFNPGQIFIQVGRGSSYFLNLETGEKQLAPEGFDPLQTEYLARLRSNVPMGRHKGPFRIDLNGKTVTSEEQKEGGWDMNPISNLIKRERFTGEMVLVMNDLPVLRQRVSDMDLCDICIDYNLECGLVIFHYEPYPEGGSMEEPMSNAYYLIRVPAAHEVKSEPNSPAPAGVVGGPLNSIPNPSGKKR